MRKNIAVSFFISLCFCASVAYCAEEKKDLIHHPTAEELQKISQPAVRPISPVSPPHMTAPISLPQTINPPVQTGPQFFQPPMMHNPPNVPPQFNAPNAPMPFEIPHVPVIGNTIGKVVNTGTDKQGVPWLEVNDDLFGEVINIKVRNIKNTPIVKQAGIMNFKDIKIGDTVNVIFTNNNEENIASFINILTEEEIEMMKGEVKPENENPPGE
jgi:hypothetical protein